MTSPAARRWRVSWWLWGNPIEYKYWGRGEQALTSFLHYLRDRKGDNLENYEIAYLDD